MPGKRPLTKETVFRGIPAAGGICRGKALVLPHSVESVPCYTISESAVTEEIQRLENALVETRRQILGIQDQVAQAMDSADARIFDAHLLVLDDQVLMNEVSRALHRERLNVESVFQMVAERYMATLEKVEDEYLRERVADIRDVTTRILDNLLGRKQPALLQHLDRASILVSHDLYPSKTALLDRDRILGFVTDVGGQTSHTSILARSLEIPAVVGLGDISDQLEMGQSMLVDGYNGVVIANPSDQTLFEYGQLVQKKVHLQESLREIKDEPAVTLDGLRMTLSANLEQPSEVHAVGTFGAEGIGLFRTEYLFINRRELPSEEEQYEAYRSVVAAVNPQPVIIRTLDLGGDKFMTHLHVPAEMNPFLGWRAIRFCLHERDIFRNQLRAILRASTAGQVKIMYPMISGLEELKQANQLLEAYQQELSEEGIPFDHEIEIGAMIETPSAVLTADSLAKRVQFFSIGTNDLIQYTLAVDRLNERISYLYEPTHPAILHLIKNTVDAARRKGIWVGVCGEMAGDPALIPLLLGLGVNELSVAAPVVPQIKFLIRRLKMQEAQELANFALNCESGAEILEGTRSLALRAAPSLFENQNSCCPQ